LLILRPVTSVIRKARLRSFEHTEHCIELSVTVKVDEARQRERDRIVSRGT